MNSSLAAGGGSAALALLMTVGSTNLAPPEAPAVAAPGLDARVSGAAGTPPRERLSDPPPAGSPVAFDPPGRGLWFVDEERDEVSLVPAADPVPLRFALGAWPEQAVVDHDGTVFVSLRGAGRVGVIRPDFSTAAVAVGAEPRALLLDRERGRLYVGLVTARALIAVDTRKLAVVARRDLGFEPRALAFTPGGIAVLPARGRAVRVLDPDLVTLGEIPIEVRGQTWRGQALIGASDALFAIVSITDTGLAQPVSRSRYGGAVEQPVRTAVATLRDGRQVALGEMKHSSGAQIARSNRSFEVDGVPTDVSGAAVVGDHLMLADGGEGLFLDCTLPHGFEDSLCIDVGRGDGLRGLAVGPRGQIWTLAAFDRVLGLIDASLEAKGHLPIGPGRFDDQLALGRSLFHRTDDARISSSGLACATCHPDGRQDGLVWRLAGERRQTPILAGRLAGTAPYNWLGTTETLEENIRQTVTRLGGRGLAEEEVRALARYLREGLRTPERPPPPDPTLVENGRRVFHDARVGCASCHAADEAFAGGGAHDVGTTGATELAEMRAVDGSAQPRAFDTPSLLFAGISAPYFHDGSAPGLDAVVSSAEHRMGNVRDLSESERRALLAYLESL